jgi:site-specific recombinase XerD
MESERNGGLARHAAGFAEKLVTEGYTRESVTRQLDVLAHLGSWLDRQGLGTDTLGEVLERYVAARKAEGHRRYRSKRGLKPLIGYLSSVGVVQSEMQSVHPSEHEEILAPFRRYLAEERKLLPATVSDYAYYADLFLDRVPIAARKDLSLLGGADVAAIVSTVCRERSHSWAKNFTAATRALLRFLFLEEELPHNLVGSVLSAATWRRSTLPQALDKAQVSMLLESCDPKAIAGRRDRAVLVLALRLGLRAAEIAALSLDDVNWRTGEVIVHGKGGRLDRLPLPADVGEAIVDYLRYERPPTLSRSVFIKALAPRVGISGKTVEGLVRRAGRRAGIGLIGPHRLRHTAATALLRGGASLAEIGQLLRHEHLETTAGYARVDFAALAPLALPWPRLSA